MGKGSYQDHTRRMLSLLLSRQPMQDSNSILSLNVLKQESLTLTQILSSLLANQMTGCHPLGDYLGDLTNELDDDVYITTFVSGGPKNYAYQTKNGKTTCKVNPNEQPTFLENSHFIKRDAKTKTIHTVNLKNRYKLVYDKRVIHGFTTLPYGYR